MRAIRPRFTIRATMILVILASLTLVFFQSANHALRLYLMDRGRLPGPAVTAALSILAAAIATAPFLMAVRSFSRAMPKDVGDRGWKIRPGVVAFVWIIVGVGLSLWPWDGMRFAWRLRDGSYVMFYHQFRLWPGREVTPCLEVASAEGKTIRVHAIADTISYLSIPDFRMNLDQTEIWLVEGNPRQDRPERVFCSLDRKSGRFVGLGGTHPPGLSVSSGF